MLWFVAQVNQVYTQREERLATMMDEILARRTEMVIQSVLKSKERFQRMVFTEWI